MKFRYDTLIIDCLSGIKSIMDAFSFMMFAQLIKNKFGRKRQRKTWLRFLNDTEEK